MERSNEYRIKQAIKRHYDPTTRPVRNDKTAINVLVAISLYHILDTVSRAVSSVLSSNFAAALQRDNYLPCKLVAMVVFPFFFLLLFIFFSPHSFFPFYASFTKCFPFPLCYF